MDQKDRIEETQFIYEDEGYTEIEEDSTMIHVLPGNYFKLLCFTQLAIVLIAFIWGWFRKIFWWNSIVFDKTVVWGAGLAAVLIFFSTILYIFRKYLKFTNIEWIVECLYIPVFGNLKIWQLVVLAVLSGFCEEALFRGVLMKESGPVISSILFGILHTGNKKLIFSGIWITMMGIALCFSFSNTGNLLVPMTAHFLNNMVSFIGLAVMVNRRNSRMQ